MRRWPGTVMLIFALVLVGAACSKSNDSGSSTTTGATTGGSTTGGSTTGGSTTGGTTTGGSTTGGSTSGSEGGGQITINGDAANDHGSKAVSGMSTFELEADNGGGEFYFDPTTLKGTPGETLKIEVKNEGDTKHNFTIDDQKIDEDIDPGKSTTVTVKFPSTGVVEFFCEYHKSLGMVGQLQAS
jgi:plastocyanin